MLKANNQNESLASNRNITWLRLELEANCPDRNGIDLRADERVNPLGCTALGFQLVALLEVLEQPAPQMTIIVSIITFPNEMT